MNNLQESFSNFSEKYLLTLTKAFGHDTYSKIFELVCDLNIAWSNNRKLFICGNGGSAANAIHIANDLHYGVAINCKNNHGILVEALPANVAIVTCLANDTGYDNIYAQQLSVKAKEGDVLLALSGSGNSQNIVNAIDTANSLNMKTHAILAFTGGKCMDIAHNAIHFPVNDMQIAEDTQLIIGHLCMQYLNKIQ